jgi:hypothetical protein
MRLWASGHKSLAKEGAIEFPFLIALDRGHLYLCCTPRYALCCTSSQKMWQTNRQPRPTEQGCAGVAGESSLSPFRAFKLIFCSKLQHHRKVAHAQPRVLPLRALPLEGQEVDIQAYLLGKSFPLTIEESIASPLREHIYMIHYKRLTWRTEWPITCRLPTS